MQRKIATLITVFIYSNASRFTLQVASENIYSANLTIIGTLALFKMLPKVKHKRWSECWVTANYLSKMDIMEEIMKLLSSILLATSLALLPMTQASADTPTKATQVKMQKLSINKASIEQLTQLPGIGESKAKAIVEHRTKQGPFKSVEQLKEVKGIGDKLFAKLEGKITL